MQKKRIGRPPKYTPEEARVARNKQHNNYVRTAYEKLQEQVPIGTNQRLKDASALEGMSKRGYLISAIEERLKKTEKNSQKQ